jgi:CBS domain-containing protein
MLVRDVMEEDPITCQVDIGISDAARLLRENEISGMPVLDGSRLAGIVSESDLLKLLNTEKESNLWLPSPLEIIEIPIRDIIHWEKMQSGLEELSKKKVSEIMSRKVYSVGPDESVERAAFIMTRHKINRLPVIEDEKLVGIITRGDIIEGLGAFRDEED